MVITFADMLAAQQFYELFRNIAEDVVNTERPAYRYGVVTSIDTTLRKCVVSLNGEDGNVIVNLGALAPIGVGQLVRVAGLRGDFFVDDIFDANGILGIGLSALAISGIATASIDSRYIGATAGSQPLAGFSYLVGDYALDTVLVGLWICTLAGDPGTWEFIGLPTVPRQSVSVTANILGITTITTVIAAASMVLTAGKVYSVRATGAGFQSSVAGDVYQVGIYQDALEVGRTRGSCPVANNVCNGFHAYTEVTGTGVPVVFTAQAQRALGTGTLMMQASSTDPSFLVIEEK